MEVCFLASGEVLATLDPIEHEGKSALAIKQSLAAATGISRFRQRLFWEDGSGIQDDDMLETVPAKVQLVVLEFYPSDAEQSEEMMSACQDNDVKTLEKLLQRPLEPKVTDEDGATLVH